MGIEFPNPVGLAAGFDKDGRCIDGLFALGFGFVELGTVTPRPQPGNPRPRLFRLPESQAIINRMGFNNAGVGKLGERVRRSRGRGVIGVNIGKNRATPLREAPDDYCFCLRDVYPYADYVAVNISSPNTPGLRDLQRGAEAERLLERLRRERQTLSALHGRSVPLMVKIDPDLQPEDIEGIAEDVVAYGFDGIIATNTTVSREGVAGHPLAGEAGGLSGAPLAARSTACVRQLREALGNRAAIIGVGGILDAPDARAKVGAGADLVQLYTGLIYRGPGLVREACRALSETPGSHHTDSSGGGGGASPE
jgi:dihydroorotate dehydrogenase